MDENNPLEIDPRPNRRKDKDNPYTIFTVGIKTDSPHYFVQFKDNAGNERCLEICPISTNWNAIMQTQKSQSEH